METTQLYNEFIKICDEVLKFVTTQRLVYGALISLSFFLFWSVISILSSHVRKFYRKCAKLERYLKRNDVNSENISQIDSYCSNISRVFLHGWNKFRRAKDKKPSDVLTKRDVFDAEVSDGLLNHGKTLMKTYIAITTVLLFIFNLAFLGKDFALTFNILVESMFLPFVYYVVMMLMYFISNLIKQQEYIIATTHFYSLVDKLDECFLDKVDGKIEKKEESTKEPFIENDLHEQREETVLSNEEEYIDVEKLENDELAADNKEENELSLETQLDEVKEEISDVVDPEISENAENDLQVSVENQEDTDIEENQENEEVFDESLETEENNVNNEQLPIFDLESFKINDDVPVSDEQDKSFEEKNEETENFEEQLENFAENDNVSEDAEESLEQENEIINTPIERNWESEDNIDNLDVFKKKNINVDKYINEIPNEEIYTTPFIDVNSGVIPSDENLVFHINKNDEVAETKNIENEETTEEMIETNETELESEEELIKNDESNAEENIDESNQLIEEIENIETEEKPQEDLESFDLNSLLLNEDDENEEDEVEDENQEIIEQDEIVDESLEEKEIIEDAKQDFEDNEVEDQSTDVADYEEVVLENENIEENQDISNNIKEDNETDNIDQYNNLKSMLEQNLSESTKEIDSKLESNVDLSALVAEFKKDQKDEQEEDLSALVDEFKQSFHDDAEVVVDNESEEGEDNNGSQIETKELVDKINDLENLINETIKKEKNKETNKKSSNSRSIKGKTKMENQSAKKSRGRPKMKEIDETLVIKNEQEFEDILSRAEKLMRKSEEGLSASQSKRIEKELKIMMDAMNKYKEGVK